MLPYRALETISSLVYATIKIRQIQVCQLARKVIYVGKSASIYAAELRKLQRTGTLNVGDQ